MNAYAYPLWMSTVVFGVIVLFAVYAMAHFLHEWWESRRSDDDFRSNS